MKITRMFAALAVSGLVFTLSMTGASADVPGFVDLPQQASGAVPVCPGPATPGSARCHAWLLPDGSGPSRSASGPAAGYTPAQLLSAYNLAAAAAANGATATVAIVDAYDDPKAENDLAVYRAQWVLPPCTTANGCFKKVNQNGAQGNYPPPNSGWALEISLDLDMVSAICPQCKILLVEANSNSFVNLAAAVNTAASSSGVVAISNSYGGGEFSTEASDTSYTHPGIAITASSGDSGFAVEYPAASASVTAVGGTTLVRAANTRGWSETAWSKAGSGCSKYIAQPAWQSGLSTTCPTNRMVADVSFAADPGTKAAPTGVAVFDTFAQSGWLVVGGTSVGAPAIAATYALAGNASTLIFGSSSYLNTASLYDVTSGSNLTGCTSNLCNAGPGWDGPTGNGTPNGTGAF